MSVRSLGYVGIASDDLTSWEGFATRLLGVQLAERTSTSLALRVDDRRQRLLVDTTLAARQHYYGWEVEDGAALQALAGRLEAAGVSVSLGSADLAEKRGVQALIQFSDPAGHLVEAFHGQHRAVDAFEPARPVSGFRTGSLGLGHAVLTVADVAPMLAFYCDLLGFRVSDFMLSPFPAYFLHVNQRHHSLALIGTGQAGLHHLMLEMRSLDDVGQAYDIAQLNEDRIGVTLGRHSNDFMTSFYARSPSDFMVECGWGGRTIDPQTWQPHEFFHGASLWGHERYWLPPDRRAEARDMRIQAAADGFRAPVHVLDGQYVIAPDS